MKKFFQASGKLGWKLTAVIEYRRNSDAAVISRRNDSANSYAADIEGDRLAFRDFPAVLF